MERRVWDRLTWDEIKPTECGVDVGIAVVLGPVLACNSLKQKRKREPPRCGDNLTYGDV